MGRRASLLPSAESHSLFSSCKHASPIQSANDPRNPLMVSPPLTGTASSQSPLPSAGQLSPPSIWPPVRIDNFCSNWRGRDLRFSASLPTAAGPALPNPFRSARCGFLATARYVLSRGGVVPVWAVWLWSGPPSNQPRFSHWTLCWWPVSAFPSLARPFAYSISTGREKVSASLGSAPISSPNVPPRICKVSQRPEVDIFFK